MKHLLLVLFIAANSSLYAQIIPSSCTSNAQLDSLYISASKRLALRHIWATDSVNRNHRIIHQATIDTFMNALVAVHNVQNMPARDSVIDMYKVHIDPELTMRHFVIDADSSSSWLHPLRDSILPCGSPTVDSVYNQFGLRVTYYDDYTWFTQPRNYHSVSFETDTDLNIVGLCKELMNDASIFHAQMNAIIRIPEASTDDIQAEVYTDFVELTYRKCFRTTSGCIAVRFWTFKVYNNCSVQFVKSSGDPAWPLGYNNPKLNSKIIIYPNPIVNSFSISYKALIETVSIYNFTGELVQQVQNKSYNNYDISNLPNGTYFVRFQIGNEEHVERIVKM